MTHKETHKVQARRVLVCHRQSRRIGSYDLHKELMINAVDMKRPVLAQLVTGLKVVAGVGVEPTTNGL